MPKSSGKPPKPPKSKTPKDDGSVKLMKPQEIFDALGEYVIGQEQARKVIAIAAYHHLRRLHINHLRRLHAEYNQPLIRKSNILMIGPTGSGKTHIARNLARIIGVPMAIVDATEYTEAGYYGKDVEVMVAELLFQQQGDVESTQRGIIFIDEFDKIASASGGMRTGAGSRDIGGKGVQQALLRLMEGETIFVPMNVTQHWNQHEFVQVDVSDILFICAGAFSEMRGFEDKAVSGFGNKRKRRRAREVSTKELVKFGFIPELLGRVPVVTSLEEHDVAALRRILTEPKDAVVREYQDVLAVDEVDLVFTDDGLDAIAELCIKKNLGARGLRAIVDKVLQDVMFEAPSSATGQTVTVDRAMVRDRVPPEETISL